MPSTVMVGPSGSVPDSIAGSSRARPRPRPCRRRRRRRAASTRSSRGTSRRCRGSAGPAGRRRRARCSTCPSRRCRRRRRRGDPVCRGARRVLTGEKPTGGSSSPGIRERAQQLLGAGRRSTTSSTRPTGRPGSWSMWTSSMLTPISPASAKSRASSPGWSGTDDEDRARRSRRAAVLAGDGRRAGDAAGQDLDERSAVDRVGARRHERVEVGAHLGEQVERRPRSWPRGSAATAPGRPPRRGSRRGRPGPTARGARRGRRREPSGDEHGEQVRQVRGPGDRPVVLLRRRAAPARRRTAATSASTSATASGRRAACGVTAQGRPSKRAALAASGPERSLPAIGWLPT